MKTWHKVCKEKISIHPLTAPKEKSMLSLVIGIVIGAVFHKFWHDLYFKTLVKVKSWLDGR